MEDMDMVTLGVNCENAYYNHESNPDGNPRRVTYAGDRIMCTLMTGALYFLNGWGTQSGGSHTTDPNNAALKEYIRCAI
ncbi:hypothetical protein AK88_05623, partial [Plasmodium fragile]